MIGSLQGSARACSTVGVTARRGDGASDGDEVGAVGLLEHVERERLGRRPEGDLAAVEAQHDVPAARLVDVVRGDEQRAALAGQPHEQLLEALGADASRPVKGSSRSTTSASCTSARATSTRWRWPPERSPKVACAWSARPMASSASRACARSRAARAPPPGQARDRAHDGDVERADREVQPRALGLRHDPAAGGSQHGAQAWRELAEQDPEQRRLAAAVGPEHGHALARPGREGHVAQDDLRAVAGRQALAGDERGRAAHRPGIVHPCLPPVKPRTIALALARSMPRYVAPGEPAGPSVSP